MVRLYARALKGRRARGTRPQKREKNVSIIGAITLKEVLTFFNVLGAADRVTFEAYIIRKLVPKLWKGACVVLDNSSIHTGKVEKAIQNAGGRVIYLSPYSPDFSPIKNCWSKVKGILRAIGARTYRALDDPIFPRLPHYCFNPTSLVFFSSACAMALQPSQSQPLSSCHAVPVTRYRPV